MRAAALIAILMGGCGGGGDAGPDAAPACARTQIFLDREGGTYFPTNGPDNAGMNQMPNLPRTVTFAPSELDDTRWSTLHSCLESKLAPFAIELTDDDPGFRNHFEVVYVNGADWSMTGVPPNYASMATITCMQFAAPIVLMNTDRLNDTDLCEATASSLMFSQGLDTVLSDDDLMGFGGNGPDRQFLDEDLPCGDNAARDCFCGGTTQNSYEQLMAVFGPAC